MCKPQYHIYIPQLGGEAKIQHQFFFKESHFEFGYSFIIITPKIVLISIT